MFNEPWQAISNYPVEHREELLLELGKKLSGDHLLFGLKVCVLAKRIDCDDILLKSHSDYYIVHLTWSGKVEQVGFPTVKHFAGKEAVLKKLAANSEEYG